MRLSNVFSACGKPKNATICIQLSDVPKLLTDQADVAFNSDQYWNDTIAATITCESNDCRIAFGTEASSTVGHILAANESIRITNMHMVKVASLINKTPGQNAVLQVTFEC